MKPLLLPVIQLMTVCVILIMTILFCLKNKQIGHVAAFAQAPTEEDVCAEMPRTFELPGKVWKLKRCVFGFKQAPCSFFLHTKNQLEDLGFTQSVAGLTCAETRSGFLQQTRCC